MIDVHPFSTPATGKDIGATAPGMGLQEFPGLAIQRDLLVLSPLGVPDVNKS